MSILLASKEQVDAIDTRVDGLDAIASIVAPGDSPRVASFISIGGNFRVQGCRVIARKSGTLSDMYYAAGAVITGAVRGAVYDAGATTSTVRTKVWDGQSVTPPGTSRWVYLGDPQIAVTAGKHLDFAIQLDTSAAEYGRATVLAGSDIAPLPGNIGVITGTAFKLAWVYTGAGSFVTPATLSEANCAQSVSLPVIIARIV